MTRSGWRRRADPPAGRAPLDPARHPGLPVFRPADAVETLECWQPAIEAEKPSILALSRQNLRRRCAPRSTPATSAKGAYVIAGDKNADAVIFATGSEVAIAVASLELLRSVASAPRWCQCRARSCSTPSRSEYRDSVDSQPKAKVAIEAGIEMSWLKLPGRQGPLHRHAFRFGASAPAEQLYEHFGITAKAIVEVVMAQL